MYKFIYPNLAIHIYIFILIQTKLYSVKCTKSVIYTLLFVLFALLLCICTIFYA